jgi:hypothetical protein
MAEELDYHGVALGASLANFDHNFAVVAWHAESTAVDVLVDVCEVVWSGEFGGCA